MCKLTYGELILLDNLIYLKWNAHEDKKLINIVYDLINDGDFTYLMNEVGNCIINMSKDEWINILELIIEKPNLKSLRIKNVDAYYKNEMKYACFIDDENNPIVVFRGTTTTNEWEDNGQSANIEDTNEQIDALKFINGLDYENITVTGHSKGGNKAEYVTILSPKIDKCISINGPGFSGEFTSKYSEEINKNKTKIISFNAKYDYINCLFNSISGEKHYINTEIQINPIDYHKASILLDKFGGLRQETNEAVISKIINSFSMQIISSLPKDVSKVIIGTIINIVELVLCRYYKGDNLLKIAGEYLLMYCYENHFKYQEIFNISYAIVEILILPLIFWNDFISVEESKSKQLSINIINKIEILRTDIINKIKIIDNNQTSLIDNISKAIDNLEYRLNNEI